MYGWLWIGVIVLAIIAELLTDQLISIWFVPGAIVATILDFCNVGPVWQLIVFFVLSGIGIGLAKTVLTKYVKVGGTKTNIQAIIGESCVVTDKIDNYAGCGQVRIKGQIWSARGVNEDDVFEVGETLKVVAIEGVRVICKK